jgi:hypothetical protein
MVEVTFPIEVVAKAMGIEQRITDIWTDAYMTKVTVVYDPENTGQPQTRTYGNDG